ncbi:MAG: PAS domain-containing protein [Ferrovibrio sp.]|uniref:PAS domain-containing protein n=1 Tax=Ferrovibrio sp. TaxID=1917215 RepID=UPI00391CFF07
MIDLATIDAMRDELLAGNQAKLAAPFIALGLRQPVVRWNPVPEELPTQQIPFLLRHWHALRERHGSVRPEHVDPFDLRPVLGYVLLLDVLDDGADYRYRLYGTEVARIAGFDMTGKRTSEMVTGSLASNFYLAIYRAMLRRPEPVYSWHEMPMEITINSWDRIVLPLQDVDGRIVRIITCNVPGTPVPAPPR